MSGHLLIYPVEVSQMLAGVMRDVGGEEHAGITIAYPEEAIDTVLAIAENMSQAEEKPMVGIEGRSLIVFFKLSCPSIELLKATSFPNGVPGAFPGNSSILTISEFEFPHGIEAFQKRFAIDRRFRVSIVTESASVGDSVYFLWTCEIDTIMNLKEMTNAALN